MSRISTSATPSWPLIYGLGIVAFSVLLLALRAGIAIFLIFMTAGVAMISSGYITMQGQSSIAT